MSITLFYKYENGFAITTVVLTYLLAILFTSTLWGLGVSVFASVTISMMVLDDYFFPPVGHFTISDPQGLGKSNRLSYRLRAWERSFRSARRQAEEANRRRDEVEQLYKFSHNLLKARAPPRFAE